MTFQSIQYQRVLSDLDDNEEDDESSELPPTLVTTRETGKNGSRWNHIENLDDFFIRVYKYHQEQGFACLLLSDIFPLIQYVFIILFTTFLAVCINYQKLFDDKPPIFSEVVTWSKFGSISSGLVICWIVAFGFWAIRVIRVIHNGFKAWEIRHFFKYVLGISDQDLQNMQWRDVQHKLVEVQTVHQMCIHKKELTELDIHHRILRQKNYMLALQNKAVISCIYSFPFIGKRTFLTEGMKYNLSMILFWGPGAMFEKSWKLKSEYKDYSCRSVLSNSLSRRIFLLGVINMMLCPFIFIYQVLHSFFTYAELVKRSPDVFGARRWSPYGRLYLRHFNELEHEFHSRLSKAYDPASKYMNSFSSPILTVFAKNIAFFCGAILAVMLGLSFYDQDVLTAEHVISFMATLGIIIKVCAGFIPDENIIYNPESLMKQILSHTHYIPDEWKGRAHTTEVREEFSRLFQYKFVHLLEELFSPLFTPFILCFHLPHKSQQIVDFYRNFTVDVMGVGDVCSFAQMDVRKHGNHTLINYDINAGVIVAFHVEKFPNETKEDQMLSAEQQAENGKTELSLLHFSFKNPKWRPTDSGKQYIETIKEQAIYETLSMSQSSAMLPNQGLPGTGFVSSQNDFTTFIGMPNTPLQSLAQPTIAPEMSMQQEEALVNTSMMFARDMQERGFGSSYPLTSLNGLHHNGQTSTSCSDEDQPPTLQHTYPNSPNGDDDDDDITAIQHSYQPPDTRWSQDQSQL